jgi:urease beta subunit
MNRSPVVGKRLGMAPDVARNLAVVRPRRGRRTSAEAEALAVLAGLAVRVEPSAAAVTALVGLHARNVHGRLVGVHQAAASLWKAGA